MVKPFFIIAPVGNPFVEFEKLRRQFSSIRKKTTFEVHNPPSRRHPLQHAAMLVAQAQRITSDGPAGMVYGPGYLIFFGLGYD